MSFILLACLCKNQRRTKRFLSFHWPWFGSETWYWI